MTADITLPPGETLTVKAGEHTLQIVRDGRGHTGVMDGRGAWMPPAAEAVEWSFEVKEEHPKNSDGGSQAAAMIDTIDGMGDAMTGSAGEVIAYMADLMRVSPYAPALLVLRAMKPEATVREAARALGLGRSRMSEVVRLLIRRDPKLARYLLGASTNSSEAQSRRRKRERAVHYA